MASDVLCSCVNDPNFTIICMFIEKFSDACGIASPPINELSQMLENTSEGMWFSKKIQCLTPTGALPVLKFAVFSALKKASKCILIVFCLLNQTIDFLYAYNFIT